MYIRNTTLSWDVFEIAMSFRQLVWISCQIYVELLLQTS